MSTPSLAREDGVRVREMCGDVSLRGGRGLTKQRLVHEILLPTQLATERICG